jgi:excisionase family DNA binding protein
MICLYITRHDHGRQYGQWRTGHTGRNAMNSEKHPGTELEPRGRLCKVKEVSGYLAMSRSAIYELMERGELAYVKIGRSRRIPLSAVLALIEANRVGR